MENAGIIGGLGAPLAPQASGCREIQGMRRADHLLKTMTALRLCLEQCRRHTSPLAALDEYLRDLRQRPDLSAAELTELEATARRALAACASRASAVSESRATA